MKEKATIYDLWKMCTYYGETCDGCPLEGLRCKLSPESTTEDIDKINENVLTWRKRHPVKTRQDKLLEMFPNAVINANTGVTDICPKTIDSEAECSMHCNDCSKKYWLAEVEE